MPVLSTTPLAAKRCVRDAILLIVKVKSPQLSELRAFLGKLNRGLCFRRIQRALNTGISIVVVDGFEVLCLNSVP